MKIRDEFRPHLLNEAGLAKADEIAGVFTEALDGIEKVCGKDGREMALVRTALQEACFWAKRAMAVRPENQKQQSA